MEKQKSINYAIFQTPKPQSVLELDAFAKLLHQSATVTKINSGEISVYTPIGVGPTDTFHGLLPIRLQSDAGMELSKMALSASGAKYLEVGDKRYYGGGIYRVTGLGLRPDGHVRVNCSPLEDEEDMSNHTLPAMALSLADDLVFTRHDQNPLVEADKESEFYDWVLDMVSYLDDFTGDAMNLRRAKNPADCTSVTKLMYDMNKETSSSEDPFRAPNPFGKFIFVSPHDLLSWKARIKFLALSQAKHKGWDQAAFAELFPPIHRQTTKPATTASLQDFIKTFNK